MMGKNDYRERVIHIEIFSKSQEFQKQDVEEKKLESSSDDGGVSSRIDSNVVKETVPCIESLQNLQDILSEAATHPAPFKHMVTEVHSDNKEVQQRKHSEIPSKQKPNRNQKSKFSTQKNEKTEVVPCNVRQDSGFNCSECEDIFSNYDDLLKHAINHLRPFVCGVCGIRLTHRRDYKKHLRRHGIQDAQNSVKFSCSECDVHCLTLSGLRTHILIHTRLKPFLCEACGKTFRRSRALQIHTQAMHTQKTVHQCSQCGFNTKSQPSLLRHVQCVHGGVRRFICGLCGTRCLQNQDLRRHLKLVHNSSFPPLSSISKKAGNEVHVIPPVESSSSSKSTLEIINLAVREEQAKLMELKKTSIKESVAEINEHLFIQNSNSASDSKQSLNLLGDVAAKATPLKRAESPLGVNGETSAQSAKSSELTCGLCNFKAIDINALALHIIEHGSEMPHTVDSVKAVSQRSTPTVYLCSLPTYPMSLPNTCSSLVTVPSDVPSHMTPGATEMISPLLFQNIAFNSHTTPVVQDYSDICVLPASIHGITSTLKHTPHFVTNSSSANIILEACDIYSLRVQSLTSSSEGSHIITVLQDQCGSSSEMNSKAQMVNEFDSQSCDTGPNFEYQSGDSSFQRQHEETLSTSKKDSLHVVHDKAVQVAVSFEDVRDLLDDTFSQVEPGISEEGEDGRRLWFDKHLKPPVHVSLSQTAISKAREMSSISIPTKYDEKNKDICIPTLRDGYVENCDSAISPLNSFENCQVSSDNIDFLTRYKNDCFTCDKCSKQLSSLYCLKRHLMVHKEDKVHKCTTCDKTFRHGFNLTAHLRIHTGERPYECKVCNKRFRYPRELKDHCNVHAKKKPHKCLECGICFTRRRELSRHSEKHKSVWKLKCKFCHKMFSRLDYLKFHVQRHHLKSMLSSNVEKYDLDGPQEYVCRKCEKSFSSKPELCSHLSTHEEIHSQSENKELVEAVKFQNCLDIDRSDYESLESVSGESSLQKSNLKNMKNFFQVLNGEATGDNLINVAYQAAKGGVLLVCLNESETQQNASKLENDSDNIMYVELFDATTKRTSKK